MPPTVEDVGRERKCGPVRAERWGRDLAVELSGALGPQERRNEATTLMWNSLSQTLPTSGTRSSDLCAQASEA